MDSLATWARSFARTEEYDIETELDTQDEAVDRLVERIKDLAHNFDTLDLGTRDTEALISNVGYASGLLLWKMSLPTTSKRELLASCRQLLNRACAARPSSPSCFGFWDHIVEAYELFGARSGRDALGDELFHILLEESTKPQECVQLAALHGLNHLQDPRTADELDRLEAHWTTEQVRQYASLAKRFANP